MNLTNSSTVPARHSWTIALATIAIGALVGGQFIAGNVSNYFYVVITSVFLLVYTSLFHALNTNLRDLFVLLSLCVVPTFISATINGNEVTVFYPLAILSLLAAASYILGNQFSERSIQSTLANSTLIIIAALIISSIAYKWNLAGAITSGHRLNTGMHPNLFGLTALALFLVAAGQRSWIYFTISLAIAIAACLSTSSRSALLTILVVAPLSRIVVWRKHGVQVWTALSILIFIISVSLLAYWDSVAAIFDSIFYFQDRYRGVGSGGSGRLMIWKYFIAKWAENPIFGPGPGTLYESSGRSLYSHNMVLQLLNDSGLVGLVSFFTFIAITMQRSITRPIPETLRNSCLIAILAYFVYGVFEGRAINIGNPLSCILFFLCFAALGAASSAPHSRAIASRYRLGQRSHSPLTKGGRTAMEMPLAASEGVRAAPPGGTP